MSKTEKVKLDKDGIISIERIELVPVSSEELQNLRQNLVDKIAIIQAKIDELDVNIADAIALEQA